MGMKSLFSGLLGCVLAIGCWAEESAERDSFEAVNRVMFAATDALDRAIAKPVARAYVTVVPDPLERGIANVFDNLNELTNAANSGLQGKLDGMSYSTGRFLINTTLGIGGLFDVAETVFNLPSQEREDFGQTLAVWGVAEGPYLMLPLLGPSSVRDVPGRIIDSFTNPLQYYSEVRPRNVMRAAGLVSARAELLGVGDMVSGDRYVFVRDVYRQRQSFLVNDGVIEDDFGDDDDY
jgi:phospholipid-binding lipoprotein MlaA